MTQSLPIKTQFIPYHASKWLSLQILVDENEMQLLLQYLNETKLYLVGCVLPRETGPVSQEDFIAGYKNYIDHLKKGELPADSSYRSLFSAALTASDADLYAQYVGEDKQIVRCFKPVVQLQAHNLGYSKADGKFHHMVFGNDSILWGVQFSYPQLFEDSETFEVFRVDERFPNTAIFKSLQKWVRENTLPTPFLYEGQKTNVPMRLGKNCFSWINQHPQLLQKNIQVSV